MEKNPRENTNTEIDAMRNVGMRNSVFGTIGLAWLNVRHATIPTDAAATPSSPRIEAEVQPHWPPCTMANANPLPANVMRTAPRTSGRAASRLRSVSVRTRRPHHRANRPMGRLMRNAHRQEDNSMIRPPRVGPTLLEIASTDPRPPPRSCVAPPATPR